LLKKRIIITLSFLEGVLYRTKNFKPDYRYTKNFLDLWSIDELILIDISEKKFSKKFLDIISYFANNCFVPISVGGGLKNQDDVDLFFKYGADKIILGSDTINDPKIIYEISRKYGNQSIIQSIDCKKNELDDNVYSVFGKSGKKFIQNDPIDFAEKAISYGAGEILINNIDNDGSLLGYDLNLIKMCSNQIKSPILALGGAGNWQHIENLLISSDISAACTQNIFHFTEESVQSLKQFLKNKNIKIRN